MTITTYTDREIALTKQLSAMTATATEYQQAADKMAMDHKVERDTLRQQLSEAQAAIEASQKQEAVAWKYTHIQSGYTDVSLNYPEKISELDVLEIEPLFATQVVAPDVLKDAQRYRWLRDNSASISWNPSRFNSEIVSGFSHNGTGYLGFNFEDAINAAMGSAND